MRRADRLFRILDVLRRSRRPATADAIAARLDVSKRTVYRDVAALTAEGVPIRGEAGVGYALAAGYDLPPLMLDAGEIEAVVLGMRLVRREGDVGLGQAAENVLGKVLAVLPKERRRDLERSLDTLWVRDSAGATSQIGIDREPLRLAIREQRKVDIAYADSSGKASHRTVWPLALALIGRCHVVVAWCELRRDFRSFRLDRIETLQPLEARYDGRRGALLRRYLDISRPAGSSPSILA